MKKLFVLLALMTFAGCQCSNQYGDCIGVADDPTPGVRYKVSVLNIILAVVFVETIFVPAYVILADLKCPTNLPPPPPPPQQ